MMALGIIGGVIGAIGSIASAQASANATNAQAAAYERQAALERQQANYNADQQQSKAIKLISSQRSAMLAAGVSLQGTPTDVLVDTTQQTNLDVQAIRYNGEIKAQNFESQAGALRAKASAQETAGAFGAISPLIKGFGGVSSGGGGDFSFGGSSSIDEG
jgi:hypothetical protein